MDELVKKRGILRGRLTRKVKSFQYYMDENVRPDDLKPLYQEIAAVVSDIELETENIMDLLSDKRKMKEQELYIEDCERIRAEVYSSLCKVIERSKILGPSNIISEVNVKVKRLDPPRFSGNVREYPTFRSDYFRLMVKDYGTDAYALRQSLSGVALDVVKGVEDDFQAMINRLDERFGNASKIVDSILNGIKAMKPVIDSTSREFVELIDSIECAWLDLKKLNLERELDNVTNISFVERLLPHNIKREWVIQVQTFACDERLFPKLVEFLVKERRVINYMDDDSRSVTTAKASVHGLSTGENNTVHGLLEVVQKIQENQIGLQRQMSELMSSAKRGQNWTRMDPRSNFVNKSYCWIHKNDNHDIAKCSTFLSMDSKSRVDCVLNSHACFCCLRLGHVARNCRIRSTCEKDSPDKERCGKFHHSLLHDGLFMNPNPLLAQKQIAGCMISKKNVYLTMSYVPCKDKNIPTLWDSGSSLSLMTHSFATKLGLKGSDTVKLTVTKVGNDSAELISKVYKVPLTDEKGQIVEIEVCGIDEITADVPRVDLGEVSRMLQVSDQLIRRPVGKVGMLVGSDYSWLLPQVVKTVGNLQLLKNMFGYCMRGSVESFDSDNPIDNVNTFGIRVNHLGYKIEDIYMTPITKLEKDFEKFVTVDSLGIECKPKCGGCKCGKCSISTELSIKDEREKILIREGMSHDPVQKRFTVTYPWISNPCNLANNYHLAFARLMSTENRLQKLGSDYARKYCDQIKDMVDRGVARRLLSRELEEYKGPIFYLPHHEIHKQGSSSTPIRIVFDSSAKYRGLSLNDCLAKGPEVLSNMFGILLRFRQDAVAVIGDIKKMYNAVHISELDQNVHRFLWRDMETVREPDHYVLTRVTFGDKPSGAIAILALHETTKLTDKYSETGERIMKNSYVDDLLVSCSTVNEAQSFIKETDEILKEGGFVIKHWVMSGQGKDNCSLNIIDSSDEKVLGLNWNPISDCFTFKFRLNFSKRRKGLRMSEDLSQEEAEISFPKFLTRRMILSQIAMIFDPLGLVSPFTLKARILMRELILSKGGQNCNDISVWDRTILEEEYNQWKKLFLSMYNLEGIQYFRPVKPKGAVKQPSLILFSDASVNAVGCCAYIRWEINDGTFSSRLLAAKSKLAPIRQVTIPRLELNGAVLSARLRECITKEMDFEFASILHITDSAVVKAQISNESLKFNTYVAVRVAEIQNKTEPKEWYWTSSENNPADLTTRVCEVDKLDSNSVWQNGPSYMNLPITTWPISQTCDIEMTDIVSKRVRINLNDVRETSIIEVERFSSYNKLLRTTARIISAIRAKSFKAILINPTSDLIHEAENIWVKWAQLDILPNWEERYRRLGPTMTDENILCVGSRISAWLECNWNRKGLVLLPSKHPFTKLYVTHLHNIDHAGIESTLVKLQSKYWIPSARKLIRSIKSKCVTCKRVDRKCAGQIMGKLPMERLAPSPPFSNSAVDLFGPMLVKDTVKGRVRKKVYGVIFNCLVSRAVYLDIAEGYDTNSFLLTLRRFVSAHGFPKTMHSDGGTNFIAANKELREMVKAWNKAEITNFGSFEGMSWNFNKSADSPWENGCSESLIRLVKRAIVLSIGNSILSYGELQTCMFEIADLLNSRPIGMKPGQDISLGPYLCPNDLILGRSTNKVPPGMWDIYSSPQKSYEYIKQVTSSFWKRWQRDYFPTLLVRQKWHCERRNIKVGDVVLIRDHNTMKGEWKIAEVISVYPSKDNCVRDVCVRYKALSPDKMYRGRSDVTVNRSAHKVVVLLPVEDRLENNVS